jgi:hypothetical protein
MNIKIDLKESSSPLVFDNAKNSYTKGSLFCIYQDNKVTKIPLDNIWRVVEEYVSANTDSVKDVWDKVTNLRGSLPKQCMDATPAKTQSEDAIEELCGFVDWEEISETPLSEDFIREFQDYVVWDYVSSNSPLSENFIREFQDKVDWSVVSTDQVLSEPFIREFQDRVDWVCIFTYQVLSEEFKEYHKDRI